MNYTGKASNHVKGKLGEDIVADYYVRSGYSIIERNWRWGRKGELDIIALSGDGEILAVCEVKSRAKGSLTMPCEAVDARKMNRIKTLAQIYMMKNRKPTYAYVRFDVAEVCLTAEQTGQETTAELVRVIHNAF